MNIKINFKITSLILLLLYTFFFVFFNQYNFFLFISGIMLFSFLPSTLLITNVFKKSEFSLYSFFIYSISLNLIILIIGLFIIDFITTLSHSTFLIYIWFCFFASILTKNTELNIKIKKKDIIYLVFLVLLIFGITIIFQNFFYKPYESYILYITEKNESIIELVDTIPEIEIFYDKDIVNESKKIKNNISIMYYNSKDKNIFISTKFKYVFDNEGTVYYSLNNGEKKLEYSSMNLGKDNFPRHNLKEFLSNYKLKRTVVLEKIIELNPGPNILYIFVNSPDKTLIQDVSNLSLFQIQNKDITGNNIVLLWPKFANLEEFYYYSLLESESPKLTTHQPPIGFMVNASLMLLTKKTVFSLYLVSLLSFIMIFITIMEIIRNLSIKIENKHFFFLTLTVLISLLFLIIDYDIYLVDTLFVLFYLIFIYSLIVQDLKLIIISALLTSGTRFPGFFLILSGFLAFFVIYKTKREKIIDIFKKVSLVGVLALSIILISIFLKQGLIEFLHTIYTETIPEHFSNEYSYSIVNLIIFIFSILFSSIFLPLSLFFIKPKKDTLFLLFCILPYFLIISLVSWPHFRYNLPFVFILTTAGLINLDNLKKKWSYLIFISIAILILINIFRIPMSNFFPGVNYLIRKFLFNFF